MTKESKIILGIDPGTKITGYGVISVQTNKLSLLDYGCIKPPANYPLEKRYLIIYNSLEQIIEKYAPAAVAVETQFMNKNAQSAMKLGMARGVAILAATKRDIPIFEYAPKKAKLSVVGTGQASKYQVQKMVQNLLGLAQIPTPEDAADALSLAICHAHMIKNE